MTNTDRRRNGRLLRKVAKLDRTWRAEGRQEGPVENELARVLGVAARAGLGRESRRMQIRNARRRGERSGWEGQA
jgi:hypothetical protein